MNTLFIFDYTGSYQTATVVVVTDKGKTPNQALQEYHQRLELIKPAEYSIERSLLYLFQSQDGYPLVHSYDQKGWHLVANMSVTYPVGPVYVNEYSG